MSQDKTIINEQPTTKELLDHLDQSSSSIKVDRERRQTRVTYRNKLVILIIPDSDPEISDVKFTVAPRNISSLGIGLIHNSYIHTNRKCFIVLQDLEDQWARIPGNIIRCNHGKGQLHEISVKFKSPINIGSFIKLDERTATLVQADIDLYNQMFNTQNHAKSIIDKAKINKAV